MRLRLVFGVLAATALTAAVIGGMVTFLDTRQPRWQINIDNETEREVFVVGIRADLSQKWAFVPADSTRSVTVGTGREPDAILVLLDPQRDSDGLPRLAPDAPRASCAWHDAQANQPLLIRAGMVYCGNPSPP
jgi:hypothetical protein